MVYVGAGESHTIWSEVPQPASPGTPEVPEPSPPQEPGPGAPEVPTPDPKGPETPQED